MYVTIVLAFIVSIIQVFWPLFLSPDYAVDKYNLYTIRRASIFGYGNPLEFGYSLLALLALVLAHFSKKSPGKVVPILVMGGITCILSNTRWIMGSFVILLIMIAIHYRERLLGRIKTILLILIVMIILTYALSSLGYDFNEFYQKRLLAEGSLDQTSRFFAYQNFLRFFPQGPWFGNGEYMSEEVWIASNAFGSSQIHVGYLAHLVAFGAIGSLFLFGFWFALTLNLRKTAMKTGYWGSFYAFLVFLWSNVTLVHYTIFFYGLIFALIFDKHYKDKNKSDLMFTPLVIKGDAG
jgi:O-antigen ligase